MLAPESPWEAERRRSRTDRAWGCHAAPVLKTGWATGPEPVAEAGQGDRLERLQCLAAALVELGGDCEAVADPYKLSCRLEVGGELCVLDTGDPFGGELGLEILGRLGAVAEGGGGPVGE